jgi:hypothetical protein
MVARHLGQLLSVFELLFAYRTFIITFFYLTIIEDDFLEFGNLLVAGWWCSVSVWVYSSQVFHYVIHVTILKLISIAECEYLARALINEPTLLNTPCEVPWSLRPDFVRYITHRTILWCDFFTKIAVALRTFGILYNT